MPKFTDLQGHAWHLAITIGDARRLKDECGIDILDPAVLKEAVDDLFKQFDLLAGICHSQMKELGVTVGDFDRRLADVQVHEAACQAMREALADFFHRARRPDLARVMAEVIEAGERLRRMAQQRIESPRAREAIERLIANAEKAMDESFDRELARLNQIPGTKSNEWPASSESTPSL